VEAFLLALAAGLIGVAVSIVLPSHLFASFPSFAERMLLEFRPDHRVFAWALAASTLACVVFGLAPALQCTSMSVSHVLKDAHGLQTPSLKSSLPSMQALVSVMALGIAGLVLRSEPHAQARAFAHSLEGLVLVQPEFLRTVDPTRLRVLNTAIFDGLGEAAGRHAVAAASASPAPGEPGGSRILGISPSYFAVLGMPLSAGRSFLATDAPDRVVVVNETLARRRWPGEDPLGKTLEASPGSNLVRREVIGVVRDTSASLGSGELISYVPLSPESTRVFVVRGSEERTKRAMSPLLAMLDPTARAEIVSGSRWLARASQGSAFIIRVVGEFGAFTLALATLGLFSLCEYTVRQRTREIGIRTALGARSHHVLLAVLRPASRALVNGLLFGTAGAVCVGFVMRRFNLPAGVHPLDIANYAGVALVLALAGLVASYRPARLATRIQSSEALRYE
jgi:ABC-type antimicrobial peptide transport system permease subunit